jgi:diaminohydroxyphosphoribosylaminopyrimidine deaminase/5-amino-6-(5-phosphoribosylamino)uracil reductase
VTAVGGRPHAEPLSLQQAGKDAAGATAYVTLEPCAHHGRTPPCATALINAGIKRVVGAAADPDPRVAGRGYELLREAGIEVVENVLAEQAADLMAGYLIRSLKKRPEVTLKLALSRDGKIGQTGRGQVAITGPVSNAQVHLMRAESGAILIGAHTAISDDPALTCRLPGLEHRSPLRIVIDGRATLPAASVLATSARETPVLLAARHDADADRKSTLAGLGVRFLATEIHAERIALPELLEDLAGQGVMTVMVEGGARTAEMFLQENLIDRIVLFSGPDVIGEDGVTAPIAVDHVPAGFELVREFRFGNDMCREWVLPESRRFSAVDGKAS